MDDYFPIIDENINPCRGCPDYDEDGCKSNGDCGRPQTNTDRIRAMSDEELAELFEIIPHCRGPAVYTFDGFCIDDGLKTKKQWLDWLKGEVKDD